MAVLLRRKRMHIEDGGPAEGDLGMLLRDNLRLPFDTLYAQVFLLARQHFRIVTLVQESRLQNSCFVFGSLMSLIIVVGAFVTFTISRITPLTLVCCIASCS